MKKSFIKQRLSPNMISSKLLKSKLFDNHMLREQNFFECRYLNFQKSQSDMKHHSGNKKAIIGPCKLRLSLEMCFWHQQNHLQKIQTLMLLGEQLLHESQLKR